ncbi:unnamed protein product [Citrullus colocynthis]|uniref:Uncharacterized protein n=1 Tax=Citrullus colocynthis TaxID=252529 RepID=A0ABP0YRM6_9ROSI
MTFTEREEKGNSSNTKLVEIKKEKVEEEEEEDIELWLNEVLKDSDSIDDELQLGASSSQNHIDKAPINEEEEDAEESERSTKRTRTAESDEAESMINKATNVEEDETEWGMDPLEVTEEIVLKYHDFIDEIYQMLKDDQKDEEKVDGHKKIKMEWQKWSEILERANVLVEALNRSLRTVALEMEWMKSIDEFKKEYSLRETHVPDLLALLRDINSRIESSPHFSLVSDIKNRGEVLTMCLDELERSKEELTEMVDVIHELKELDLQDEEDEEDDGEDGEFELKLEDDGYEELDLQDADETE